MYAMTSLSQRRWDTSQLVITALGYKLQKGRETRETELAIITHDKLSTRESMRCGHWSRLKDRLGEGEARGRSGDYLVIM